MKKIKLSKIEHRGTERIKVLFEKEVDLISKIKTIKGRRWSKTKNCWLLPYSKESFEALKKIFGEVNLDYPTTYSKIELNLVEPNFVDYQKNGNNFRKVVGDKIIVQKQSPKWLEAYVPFNHKTWIEVIRNIEGRKWEPNLSAWILPNVKATFRFLKQKIGLKEIIFNFKIEKDIPDYFQSKIKGKKKQKKKKLRLMTASQQNAIIELEERIILKRYSPSTLKSYKGHLISIFLFYPKLLPSAIEPKEIEKYILYQIKFKKISESTQNQIINAYKFYAESVLKKEKQYIQIPRPKNPRQLPNVLSQDEVIRLIKTPKNIKHRLILMLIYSCGLRLSEVINIRMRDVNGERRNIFIKAGKGKKDRFVTLADSIIPYIKIYKKQFKPVYWLLEGATGGQYSKSSVQKVLRKAVEESKVNPYATVHTLRHSYATHCVENGFSLALIQKALGHNSLKTTERYLHISNKAMQHLKSPLDLIAEKKKNK